MPRVLGLGRGRARGRERMARTPPPWSPRFIGPGALKLWVVAESAEYSGGTWTDRSGNGNNFTQSTAGFRPSFNATGINGKGALSFDGTDDILGTSAIALTSFTLAFIFKLTGAGASICEHNDIGGGLGTNGYGLRGTTGNTTTCNRAGVSSAKDRAAGWAVDNVTKVVVVQYGGTHATHTLSINGTLQSMTDITVNDPGSASVSANLYLGARGPASGGSLFSTGLFRQVVVCSPVLGAGQLAKLTAYLRADAGV